MAKKKSRTKADPAASSTGGKRQGAKAPSKASWKLLDRTTVMAAGMLAPKVTSTLWRIATGKKPPTNARHPDVAAREAVTWAVFAGVATELAKVLVRRASATYWVHSTGKLPPGLKSLNANDPAPVEDGTGVVTVSKKSSPKKSKRRRR